MRTCLSWRAVWAGVLWCAVLLPLPGAAASADWRVIKLGGRDYLPVNQIAGFYRLRAVPQGDRAISLVSDERRLDFRAGSREARLDGVKHWLSFPVIYTRGQFFISRMDLAKTLDPVVRPHRIPRLRPVRTVVLDPGHGGHDRGAVNRLGTEKNFNLDVARRIRPHLQAAGLRVIMTRRGDHFVPLEKRPAMANELDRKDPGTVFVSIHFNAAPGNRSAATGFEIFTLTPRGAPNSHDNFMTRRSFAAERGHAQDHGSMALAVSIYHAMLGRVPMFDRGIKRARFAVLRHAATPAVLVEGGFMSNPRDARLMADEHWRERLAESIALGILEYVQLTRTRQPPKLLAAYQAEEAAVLAGTDWDYQPLAGIGAMVRPGFRGARGWRGLLPAPLSEEMPSYRLEFEPRGWAQLEAWASVGEDARSMAAARAAAPPVKPWLELPPPFRGVLGWRGLAPPRDAPSRFELVPSSGGPLAEVSHPGEERTLPFIMEISGGAL